MKRSESLTPDPPQPRSAGLRPWLGTSLVLLLSILLFNLLQRQLPAGTFLFSVHPEILDHLERSLDDQKRLAELNSAERSRYRSRFDALEETLHRLQVLQHTQQDLATRYEVLLAAIFATIVFGTAIGLTWRQRRRDARLARLQEPLARLALGQPGIETGESANDTIGRLARMIEETSKRMTSDRQRLAVLDSLAAWQEAARRQVHEMRTPLTTLRMDLDRATDAASQPTIDATELSDALQRAQADRERLQEYAFRFGGFARLPVPQRETRDLQEVLEQILLTHAEVWPELELDLIPGPPCPIAIDQDMIRQVVINLCENAANAGGTGTHVRFEIQQATHRVLVRCVDDGPGIAAAVRDRLFQPYVTTRPIGEGMGLGLAISRKILLDHGGDLNLETTSALGTTFLWSLPRSPEDGST